VEAAADPTRLFAALPCAYADPRRGLWLVKGDSLALMEDLAATHPDGLFDAIFADPPYFLSNDGITCQSGRRVKVNKGAWDRSRGTDENHAFNLSWLALCQRLLRPHGTVWVSGTHHVILSVGFAMQQLGLKLLNAITWEKPNPPPNLSCRFFTHSTETLLWAAKNHGSKHVFNYKLMRERAGGKQMKSVWRMLAPAKLEKVFGKHPTQKPEALVRQCLEASTHSGALVLDPFVGGGTTAVAARQTGRRCLGIDTDPAFLAIAASRLQQPTLIG
jgi:site-specific DNA-methyltransferase (adenine-specific)